MDVTREESFVGKLHDFKLSKYVVL
jgi:hypothetical protein